MASRNRARFPITATKTIETTVLASSEKAAAALFASRHPGFIITSLNDVEPIGYCIASSQVIMPDDDFMTDMEGGYFLTKYTK